MDLTNILLDFEFLRLERPPLLWGADTDEVACRRLLDQLIALGWPGHDEPSGLSLNLSNVTVPEDSADERLATGNYVAVTLRGPGEWGPETVWWPGATLVGGVLPKLEESLGQASGRFAYTRNLGSDRAVTVFFSRLTP
jgi:hypothetical protein